jgi:catalase
MSENESIGASEGKGETDMREMGGELHQRAASQWHCLRTNQGIPIADNQNQLKVSARGPVLLEDFVLREKIFHFDHERIPERVVHARGSAAHGYFELYESLAEITAADLFQRAGEKTPVFVRFSTVAGGAGSADTPRDVRGFAVRFYTQQGNWDLVGNNIPVFFIQDAIKFPDLIHSAKMEADRGFPQAATAHDTFWDFASLMPESTHMLMWAMSDRTLPRSLRMMQGFGVHTFRLVNEAGVSTFVKFHWKPKLGMQSTLWDEAVKIAGADSDYHRRDLYESIERGQAPEWELGLQLFDQEFADGLPYDILDPTKMIPEELLPVRIVGRMVLDRNPENFFAETEQVAFCPANIVPGVDFTDDPLLQGRLFSYLDTQLKRLGSANFHQLPINRPKCPYHNFQRDGHMQTTVFTGRANYEPNSLAAANEAGGPRETLTGFRTYPEPLSATKLRVRSETFADHYSQARMFYRSMLAEEQAHIASSFVFELSKVSLQLVRERMVANLRNVDEGLAQRVAKDLGMDTPTASAAAAPVLDLDPSPLLSIMRNMRETLAGRTVGILIGEGTEAAELRDLIEQIEKAGGNAQFIAARIGKTKLSDASTVDVTAHLAGTPSVLVDAIALMLTPEVGTMMARDSTAVQFVADAYGHLKAIGFTEGAEPLLDKAGIVHDAGVAPFTTDFVKLAARRFFDREAKVRHLS